MKPIQCGPLGISYILATALLLAGPARAEWVDLSGHPDNKGSNFYVESTQSQKQSTSASLAHMLDLATPQLNSYGKPYLSERMQVEYDCLRKRARALSIVQYSKNMGQGDKVASFERSDTWVPFSTDPGVARGMEELACRKPPTAQEIVQGEVEHAHPGWMQTISNIAFFAWMAQQPPEIKALAASTKAADAIAMLDLFKAYQTEERERDYEREMARQQEIRNRLADQQRKAP